MSYLKGLQRTTPAGSDAQTFKQCTRTLCLPPTSLLYLWLRNKIRFANVVGTQKTRFLIKMNHKISHLKGFHRRTPDESGALASKQCIRTLCLPPTIFLSMWLRNKIHLAFVARITNRICGQEMNYKISHFKGVSEDNTKWVGCTSIHIVDKTHCLSGLPPTTFLFLWLRVFCGHIVH